MGTRNYFENVWKSKPILIKKSQKSVLNSLQKLRSFFEYVCFKLVHWFLFYRLKDVQMLKQGVWRLENVFSYGYEN